MSAEMSRLFRHLTNGVYVIGVVDGEHCNAFTAAWVMQVSFQPLLLALSVNPGHHSYPLLRTGRAFAVSVLSSDQLDLARHFGTQSGRDIDKLAEVTWRAGATGAPILTAAAAYFDCQVVGDTEAGDHRLVIGRVVGGAVLASESRPLIYSDMGNLDGSTTLFPDAF
ncbi:flavin reductase family protein [Gemmata sp. JC717]|uniref:flavin reductase family protein n=1 Tax=Gemmata algarum TaxID=2975278 RepID=UPI0021BB3610|nr:flavin reductase family protein [Gemmata algarum]MDY3551569.1 flavin reductase family protein [Gemmata algarum]